MEKLVLPTRKLCPWSHAPEATSTCGPGPWKQRPEFGTERTTTLHCDCKHSLINNIRSQFGIDTGEVHRKK